MGVRSRRIRDRNDLAGATVLTRAFDLGHDVQVRGRLAPPAATASRSEGGGGDEYEVPRSGWPATGRAAPAPIPAPDPEPPAPRTPPAVVPPDGNAGTPERPAGGVATPAAGPVAAASSIEPAAAPSGATAAPQVQPGGGDRAISEDDLLADIAAIVEGDRLPSATGTGIGDWTPAPNAPVSRTPIEQVPAGVPPGRNRQDIFDEIAASMAQARSYDLGAVELERRFDAFDEHDEAARSRPVAATVAAEAASAAAPPSPTPTAEFLEDLDVIRSDAMSDRIPLDPGVGGRSIGTSALVPGDIILSTTDAEISEQIRAVTGSEVSHAAIYVGDERLVEAIETGVIIRSVDTAIADDSLAVAYRHRDMTDEKAQKIVAFLTEHARKRTPFDKWGLIQVAPGQLARAICNQLSGAARELCLAGASRLRVGTNDENSFFCSELVLKALDHAGLPLSTLEPSWSSPGQIADLHLNGLLDYVGHLKA